MTVIANLEDELVLHRDFEPVDASERPRTKREARLEEARELDGKLRALVRISQQAEAELARALREIADRGLCRHLGYPRIHAYAEAVLGIFGGKAKALVKLARKLDHLPRLRAAFEAGEIPWTKVRTVTRAATPEGEERWIGKALALTSPGLKIAVAQANGEEPEFTLTVRLKGAERAGRDTCRVSRACYAEATGSCGRRPDKPDAAGGGRRVSGVLLRRRHVSLRERRRAGLVRGGFWWAAPSGRRHVSLVKGKGEQVRASRRCGRDCSAGRGSTARGGPRRHVSLREGRDGACSRGRRVPAGGAAAAGRDTCAAPRSAFPARPLHREREPVARPLSARRAFAALLRPARLPGEPPEGVGDIHFTPGLPFTVTGGIALNF